MWKKDLFRSSGKDTVEQSLPQVEKFSKLILGESRQIRNIVKENPLAKPSCNFNRREQSAEKLRAEPESLFLLLLLAELIFNVS